MHAAFTCELMSTHRVRIAVAAALVALGAGCATGSQQTASVATLPPSAAAPSDLTGVWVEYWAPSGRADTQRYELTADGTFVWYAPSTPTAHVDGNVPTATRKQGTFVVERGSSESTLVLHVTAEEFPACGPQCAHHDDPPHQVEHATPLVERYALDECAPNLEAKAVDASYACLTISTRTFWRDSNSGKPHDVPRAVTR
jgi:hypothetical protein